MGPRIAASALALAVVLVLASAPATATIAPTAASAPRVAAAQVPDLHDWRLTRHGFGRLKVGLDRTKMERRLGRSLKFSYATGSCAIWTIRGARGLTIRGRLARVYIGAGSWQTSTGIALGASADDVRARHPNVRTRPHAYDPEGAYLIVPGRHRRVVFEVDGDATVTGIRGGRLPAVMYVEGCA
jgi:hypothetical protein